MIFITCICKSVFTGLVTSRHFKQQALKNRSERHNRLHSLSDTHIYSPVAYSKKVNSVVQRSYVMYNGLQGKKLRIAEDLWKENHQCQQ